MGHFFKFTEDNPSPKQSEFSFDIISSFEHRGNLMVEVKYHNCKNYNGRKILVLKSTTLKEFSKNSEYDPHFLLNNQNLIARFRPTEEGILLARKLLTFIT